jgi:hypothetical protein
MLAVREITESITKTLALRAVKSVQHFDAALDSTKPSAPGGQLRCALTFTRRRSSPEGVPADILASMSDRFIIHYEQILKITCNAGGFSNPVSKLIFNIRFSSEFGRSFADAKRLLDKVWDIARGSDDFFDTLAFGAIHYCEQGTRTVLQSDRSDAVRAYLLHTFEEVHATMNGSDVRASKRTDDSHPSDSNESRKSEVTKGLDGGDSEHRALDAAAEQS